MLSISHPVMSCHSPDEKNLKFTAVKASKLAQAVFTTSRVMQLFLQGKFF
jgi:hypothetical protein